MNGALNWLFGLDRLGFGSPGVSLTFERAAPSWACVIGVLVLAAVAWGSYRRLAGRAGVRRLLAAVRTATLVLIATLALGPELIRPNDRVERDEVLVLLDRSGSMRIADVAGAEGGAWRTRDEQLRSALAKSGAVWSRLGHERVVRWFGFADGAFELQGGGEGAPNGTGDAGDAGDAGGGGGAGPDLGEADGLRTALGRAIEQALGRAAGRPIAGLVVFSDGRSADVPSPSLRRMLVSERIPVFVVALGSPTPVADLAITGVDSPAMAFVNDVVPVNATIESTGGKVAGGGAAVELVDTRTGRVLDSARIDADALDTEGGARLTLTGDAVDPGRARWIVRLSPGGPDLIEQNNTAPVRLDLVDRPLRVLHMDGYPRWEYRYLKNLLRREDSIRSTSMVVAPDRRFLQEGDVTLDALPRTPEEWSQFDVVILGDIRPEVFSDSQLEHLLEQVARRGAGLVWLGGEGAVPRRWWGSPLGDLLPFRSSGGSVGGSPGPGRWAEPVVLSPTPLADRLGLLRLGSSPGEPWPARLSDPATGWSRLWYAQRIEAASLKPTAEVLARATGQSQVSQAGSDASTPLVLTMRYGAGRSVYVGTDEIWRWRYARGEALPERFWLPLIRFAGRDSLARIGRSAVLEVSPRRVGAGQPVRIVVRLIDQALVDLALGSVRVRLTPLGQDGEPASWASPIELTLGPEGGGSGGGSAFAGTWLSDEPGVYRVEVSDSAIAGEGTLRRRVEVIRPDDEMRRPEADHALLGALAEASGGAMLGPGSLDQLPDLLPNRQIHVAGTPDVQTLWDRPVVLLTLVLLLGGEWIGRRLIHLP